MSKEDFMKTLDEKTKEFIEFLIDCAYANGFSAGLNAQSLEY